MLNPNIILQPSANPVQLQSPVDTFAKMLSLRELMARAQGAQLTAQQQQQSYNDNQSLRSLFASNPTPTAQQIYSAGGPTQGTAIIKGMTEAQQAAANLQDTKNKLQDHQNQFMGSVAGMVRQNNYSPDSIKQAFQLAADAGYGQYVQHFAAQIQQNPASAKQIFDSLYQTSMSSKDQATTQTAALTAQIKQETAKEQARHDVTAEQQAANNALEMARNNAFNNKAKALEIQQANARNAIAQQQANTAAARTGIERERYGLEKGIVGNAGPAASGEAALQGLNPGVIAQIKAIDDYRQPPYTRGTGVGAMIMQKLAQYDPDYDVTQFKAVNNIRRDFTSGSTAKSINAINTAIGHLGELQDAANGLNNTTLRSVNRLENWWKGETDDPGIRAYSQAANAVASELSNAYQGHSEGEVQRWQKNADPAMGPQSQKAAIRTAVGLLAKKIGAIQDQWSKTPLSKRGAFPVLGPDAKATLQKLGYDPNTLKPMSAAATVKMQAPDGSVSEVPASSVDHYTKLGAKVVR